MSDQVTARALWSSRAAFILAASGSAVGLGNIWKFPYLAGSYGGGAFVLVYIACVVIIGAPIMIAETMLGKHGRGNPAHAMLALAQQAKTHPAWQYLGWVGIIIGFLILSYYSVIAGWSLAYIFKVSGALNVNISPANAISRFNDFKSSSDFQIIWHTLFMGLTYLVVSGGVSRGLERTTRYMMPALLVMLLLMDIYALNSGGFLQGLRFLLHPDFSKLTTEGLLAAMGQAFFSLGVGMGAIMVYGSYLPDDVSIPRSSVIVCVTDTIVALMAGMAIFPIVFANGLEPSMGAGLIFETLPIAFGHMPGGGWLGAIFFILVFFAAITSAIALIEPAIALLSEKFDLDRARASLLVVAACWLAGFGTVYSFGENPARWLHGKTFFELIDFVTSDLLLPISGVLIAIFSGWKLSATISRSEFDPQQGRTWRAWLVSIRYIAPAGVVLILLDALGLL
ncbi:sodium-dependent transporter [Candidatus Methylospira mobilis]|uniref:Transporter n=1 Tax=Candidatus Methylospira mobilis TaxID=1808979 RepID=A0A5Q0BP97_9GAMM|nr:sodium-dependent transporter [Candidatus Methylospira mobilis]QFY43897.1 sodium-dependent transporter [Candidatus Methylospira mobilis]WNV04901.1 sodium-dependent transporter [Candidatus Methylospira mobilis]